MAITVRAGKMPGGISDYEVEEGATVAEVLSAASLDPTGFEVRRQGMPVEMSDTVEDGQLILLVRKVKGNFSRWLIRS